MKKIYLVVEPNDKFKNISVAKTDVTINEKINDTKWIDKNIVEEGFNQNNILEYIQLSSSTWIIDCGVVKNKRHLYLVDFIKNEILFSYIVPPKEYDEISVNKDLKLEDIVFHLTELQNKKSNFINNFTRFENQNMNLPINIVKKLFNTIYVIINNHLLENNIKYFYFCADQKELSRVKLYNTIYRLLEKENSIDALAIVNKDSHQDKLDEIRNALGFSYGMFINNFKKGYEYYIFLCK